MNLHKIIKKTGILMFSIYMTWALLMYMGDFWAFSFVNSTQERADIIAYYTAITEDEIFTKISFCIDSYTPRAYDVHCLKENGFNVSYVDGEEYLLEKRHSMPYLALRVFLVPVSCLIFLLLSIKVLTARHQRNLRL